MATCTERFVKNIFITQIDGRYFIEKIKDLATWKEDDHILDVGCGPGSVTHDFLLPILPKSATLTASDKATDAINYANQHYGKSSRIVFKQMDIESPNGHFYQYFDHIVSFYCLHFIGEQQIALQNIFRMLKPGGDFFFTCVVQFDGFEITSRISQMKRYQPYRSEFNKYVSPYQHSDDPIGDLQSMLEGIGFNVDFITSEPREYYYPMDSIKEVFLSHHSLRIPKEIEEEFQMDLQETIRDHGCSKFKEGKEFYHNQFRVLFGRAIKSTKCVINKV